MKAPSPVNRVKANVCSSVSLGVGIIALALGLIIYVPNMQYLFPALFLVLSICITSAGLAAIVCGIIGRACPIRAIAGILLGLLACALGVQLIRLCAQAIADLGWGFIYPLLPGPPSSEYHTPPT